MRTENLGWWLVVSPGFFPFLYRGRMRTMKTKAMIYVFASPMNQVKNGYFCWLLTFVVSAIFPMISCWQKWRWLWVGSKLFWEELGDGGNTGGGEVIWMICKKKGELRKKQILSKKQYRKSFSLIPVNRTNINIWRRLWSSPRRRQKLGRGHSINCVTDFIDSPSCIPY